MKATVGTVKGFIKKNRENLLVRVELEFDPMCDGISVTGEKEFKPATPATHEEHTCGVKGVWLVGRGRDFVTPCSFGDGLRGYQVSNSCGTFSVAVRK